MSGVARGDPPQTPIKSIELKLKSNEAVAELDFNFTEVDLTEVAQGEPALTLLKATGLKLKSNEVVASSECKSSAMLTSWTCPSNELTLD